MKKWRRCPAILIGATGRDRGPRAGKVLGAEVLTGFMRQSTRNGFFRGRDMEGNSFAISAATDEPVSFFSGSRDATILSSSCCQLSHPGHAGDGGTSGSELVGKRLAQKPLFPSRIRVHAGWKPSWGDSSEKRSYTLVTGRITSSCAKKKKCGYWSGARAEPKSILENRKAEFQFLSPGGEMGIPRFFWHPIRDVWSGNGTSHESTAVFKAAEPRP